MGLKLTDMGGGYGPVDKDPKASKDAREKLQAAEAAEVGANKVVQDVMALGTAALAGSALLANLPGLTNKVQGNLDPANAPITQNVGTKEVTKGSFADKYSEAIAAADPSKMDSNKALTIGEFTSALNAGDRGEDFKFIHANSGQEVTYQEYSDDDNNSRGYIITRK
jgi:hypothetical protein